MSFFLSRNSAGEGTVRSTILFASVWFVLQFGLGLSMVLFYGVQAAELVNFVPTTAFSVYWIAYDILKCVFYLTALIHSLWRDQARTQATAYAAFNLFCYSVSLIGDILLSTHGFRFHMVAFVRFPDLNF